MLKNSVWLVWIALWLFKLVSADLLHAHDFLEHPENHGSCLVCHIGDQPAATGLEPAVLTVLPPTFTEQLPVLPHDVLLQPPARLRPLIPRGPPLQPSFSPV